jgi:hypothetical protein
MLSKFTGNNKRGVEHVEQHVNHEGKSKGDDRYLVAQIFLSETGSGKERR